MRLEHNGARRDAEPAGLLPRRGDERLVSAMHAVEIADGQRRAARGGRKVGGAMDDAHGPRHRALHRARSSGSRVLHAAFVATGRAGTISTASPSSTGLPATEQMLSKRA